MLLRWMRNGRDLSQQEETPATPYRGDQSLYEVGCVIKRGQVTLFARCDSQYGAGVARRDLSDSSVTLGSSPLGRQDIAIP
jgi:hypothetical protein